MIRWIVMWVHRMVGHEQESGCFFNTPDWSQPVYCSCGREWLF